jgi:hypothetical protein
MIGATTITLEETLLRESFPIGPTEAAMRDNVRRRRKGADFLLQLRYVTVFVGCIGSKGGTGTEGMTGLGPQLIRVGVIGVCLLLLILFGECVGEAVSHFTYKAAFGDHNCARGRAGMDPWTRLPKATFAVRQQALLVIRNATCGWSISLIVRLARGQACPRYIA